METTAILRGVRLSAQKGRLVADLIRGKQVESALYTLAFTQQSPMPSTMMVPILTSCA
jgi:large subunit ribosomal protein L22